MDSPDIQAKYHKLATEYTKLRAQNQVLKKHIIEEQGKTTDLTDSLKNRDQLLRKAQGENESLIFRNQQLTKRLTLLQEDLDEIQSKKKGRGRSGSENVVDGPSIDNNIFSEELQLKIKENARLQSELADVEANYRRRISELEAALEKSQQESQRNRELLQIRDKSTSEMVDQLENERVRQVVVGQQREAEIQSLKEQLKALQERIGSSQMSEASRGDQETPTQDMTSSEQSSKRKQMPSYSLDIPMQNGREKPSPTSARSLVESFDGLIRELCDLCAEFLLCYSRRIKLYDRSSEVKLKLIEHLKSAATPWHSLSSSYHQMAESVSGEGFIALETLSGLPTVSQWVVACEASLRKVLPLVVHWISERSMLALDGDRVDAAWIASFSRLVSSWGSLAPYVAALASQSTPNSNLPPSAQGRVITMLSDRLANLFAAFKEAASVYQRKATAEKEQLSKSGEANTVNEEIVNALNSLSSTTSRMSTTFREQVVPSWNRGGSTPSTPSSPYPSMPYGLSKSPSNSNSVTQDESHQVLYDGTLSSPINDSNFGDAETSLKKQLAVTSSKLSQLEAEREHWRLEHQLLQCKLQKVTKRVKQLEQQLKGDTASSEGDTDQTHAREHSASVISNTSYVGEVQSSEGVPDEREKDIRNHFTSRCSHLYMQLTSALSQASLYQNECESLMKRLVVSEENQTSTEVEVDKQRENVSHLKETLQTTSRNYEEQISTMSDHLADLNERIANQTEYIEQLKYEIKTRKGKK
ncbi:protein phosphatase 1 regulatory subunit 21-like isoform X1 [Palaemon carinicauda]|uniref:protein phosphatase 1 regulatory subunit 21-like isoform X1 n=1 Tax=Palaemon carinicauda TaxID=392227 RepID=UPI0035B58173